MRRLALLLTLLLAGLQTVCATGVLNRDSQLRMGRLPNGLTYYIYPNRQPKGEAVYRLFVRAGSAMEDDSQLGLAHFLEHVAFSGTRHFPGQAIMHFLQSNGAKFGTDLNAQTSFTETEYKLQLPTANRSVVDSTLLLLADWACGGMSITPAAVERERGIILSERRQRNGSGTGNRQHFLDELFASSIYARRLPIGDSTIVSRATAEQLRRFYEQCYTPSRMAVAVVGDVDVNRVEKLIKRYFSALKSSVKAPQPDLSLPPYTQPSVQVFTSRGAEDNVFEMIARGPMPPAVATADDYRDYLLRAMINRLFKLRFTTVSFADPAYADASIQYAPLLGAAGVLDASATLSKGKIESGITDFLRQYRQLMAWGFTSSEIRRVGRTLERRLRLKAESRTGVSSSDIMQSIYSDFSAGNRFISLHDELALMQRFLPAVDSVAVLQAMRRILPASPRHYLLTGNASDVHLNDSALQRLIASVEQEPVPARYYTPMTAPDSLCDVPYRRHIVGERPIPELHATDLRLDNGTRVIYRQTAADRDRITVSGFRRGGQYAVDSAHYVTGIVGPPIVTLSGAGDFTRDALSAYLSGTTASVRFLVDKQRTGVSGMAQLSDMETMFQLLWLRWVHPRLDHDVYQLTMSKIGESDSTRHTTPQDAFTDEMKRVLNGDSYIFRKLTTGRIRKEVREADVLPVMRRWFYGPADGYTFIVSSAAPLDSIRPTIETYIGGLPGGKGRATDEAPARHVVPRDTVIVAASSNPGRAVVTMLSLQYRDSTEYFDRQLLQDLVKNVLRQALLNSLRTRLGKVYSVSVGLSSSPYPTFEQQGSVSFVCQPADVDTLLTATRQVIRQLVSHPDQFDDLMVDAKASLLKDYRRQSQRSAYWTTWIRNAIYTGNEDWSRLLSYERRLQAVTGRQLADFLRQAFVEARHVTGIMK